MAGYSSWVATDDWRVIVSGSVSNSSSSSTCTVTVTCKVETWYGTYSGNWSWYTTCGSSTGSTSSYTGITSTNTTYTLGSQTFTVTKTTSSQSYTVKAKVWVPNSSHSSYVTGATASTTVTIPALASYTVSYNANGGSGAPSSQTKYYGKTLTLSSTKPTRTGYNFLGWSTSSTATTATYGAGGSYTANSAATLYAVWETAIVAPTLSSFKAYRCDSGGTEDDEGEYAYLSVGYSADTTYNGSNVVESLVFSCSTASGSVTVSPSAVSGTVTGIMSGVGTDLTHTITATATDSNGSTTSATAKVGVTSFILDFSDTGQGIGFMCPAPDDGVEAYGASLVYRAGDTMTVTNMDCCGVMSSSTHFYFSIPLDKTCTADTVECTALAGSLYSTAGRCFSGTSIGTSYISIKLYGNQMQVTVDGYSVSTNYAYGMMVINITSATFEFSDSE